MPGGAAWRAGIVADDMRVLGIETSCDETGVALYDTARGLVADALHSQVALHRDFGGVVPELASRDHVRRVLPLVVDVLRRAGLTLADLDAIAYTKGPGLAGALLVGASIANALGFGPFFAGEFHHLHETDFAGFAFGVSIEAAFLPDDRFDQQRIDAIALRGGDDLRLVLALAHVFAPPVAGDDQKHSERRREKRRDQNDL
jgi:hypothetical protein